MKLSMIFLILFFKITSVFSADINQLFDESKLPNPFEGQSNLYNRIFTELNSTYQQIGQRQADNILHNNNYSVTGGLNSIGFSYNRPFGEFSITLNRSLAPDLFDDNRWIVTDTFSINIEASKVMQNLKNQKVINMDSKMMAAFVGLVFKRTFTWVHFAESYEEGLSSNFEKLFFPFKKLTFEMLSGLNPNEMIFKEDSLSASAGGFVSAPLYPGLAVRGGVLAKFKKMSRFEAIGMDNNHVQISLEKSSLLGAGFSVSVEGVFLKAIQLTLLSYDFDYAQESSYKISTDFDKHHLNQMPTDSPVAVEIEQMARNRNANFIILAPYLISEQRKISQSMSSSYNFLIFGGKKTSETEEIDISANAQVKKFFKHYYEKFKFTEGLFSKLFASALSAFTRSNAAATKLSYEKKKVEIEYQSEKNLLEVRDGIEIGSPNPDSIDKEEKLSLHFSGEFVTNKSSKKYKERAIFALESYTGIDPSISQMIDKGYLRAPISIEGHYQVNTDGIRYFNQLPTGIVLDTFAGLCQDRPKTIFKAFRSLFNNCRKSLENDYLDYYKDLSHNKITSNLIDKCEKSAKRHIFFSSGKKRAYVKNCLSKYSFKDSNSWSVIPLWTLKKITQNIVNNSNSKIHFYNLFGIKNVFFYGSVDAINQDGSAFTSSFHEGPFIGFGSVDHYMRKVNLRLPGTVIINQ